MITKNNAEKVVKLSNYSELQPGSLFQRESKKTVYCIADFYMLWCKMMIDQNFLMNNLLHISCTNRIIFEENISVENNALIKTIIRNSTVEDSTMYKNDISSSCNETFFRLK